MQLLVPLLALATLVSPVDGVRTSAPPRGKYLGLSDILKRMETSPVVYQMEALEKLRDLAPEDLPSRLWPQRVEPVPMPRVVRGAKGRWAVVPWKVPPKAEAMLAEAERLYAAKQFPQAAAEYRRILKVAPDFYLVEASLGDCSLFAGDPQTALGHYDAALRRNPDDYRLHFYRGNALMELTRTEDAVDAFATSLVLKPRNPILLRHLRQHAARLGLEVQGDLLVPRGLARREGEAVAIYSDLSRPHWLGWASCKGFWLGEASHRKELTGSPAAGWSTVEEMECLVAVVGAYRAFRADGKTPEDPAMETLERVITDGLAGAFAVYELGSRLDPQITLKVDRGLHPLLRRYVRTYVLGVPAR